MRGRNVAKSVCLKLSKTLGQLGIRTIAQLELLNKDFKVGRDGDQLLVPLLREPSETEYSFLTERLGHFEILTAAMAEDLKESRTVFDVLKDRLAPHELASLPKSIDMVGDVGIVELPSELQGLEATVGDALLRTNKKLRTILAKAGPVTTDKRLRELRVIAGSGNTETTHREFGCVFRVDVTKAYFSPRLSHEHCRVASQVQDNEFVIDLFAGVGPFAIQIARRRQNVHVYAIDVNEDAIRYLRQNVRLNRVEDRITVLSGNAKTVVRSELVGKGDRIIMNLPSQAIEYVDVACLALKPAGGVIHYYTFGSDPNPLEEAQTELVRAVSKTGRRFEKVLHSRLVKGSAPHEWLTAVDGLVR
jgi:tRNA (guanine37-N1)-methyltransferase